jgi:hypothetical protein
MYSRVLSVPCVMHIDGLRNVSVRVTKKSFNQKFSFMHQAHQAHQAKTAFDHEDIVVVLLEPAVFS